MEPIITLSHYETPLNLVNKYGSWRNRKLIDFFQKYCETVFNRYKGKVKYWLTFNVINNMRRMPGAAGGILAGLLGVKAYVYGYSTILAMPIFQDTMLAMAAGIAAAILVSAAVTFALGLAGESASSPTPALADSAATQIQKETGPASAPVRAWAKGKVIDLSQANDAVFSSGALGKGLAIIPQTGEVFAPIEGTILSVFPGGHAICLQNEPFGGILLHIGIDTVTLNGKGFETLVKEGQHVKQGELLGRFDLDIIQSAGLDSAVMMILTEPAGSSAPSSKSADYADSASTIVCTFEKPE